MIISAYCGQKRYDTDCICGKTKKCMCYLSFIKPKEKAKH